MCFCAFACCALSVFGDLTNLWSLLLVIIPFAAYYAVVPMFLILVPTSDKSQAKKVMDKKMTNTQSIFIEAQKQVQSQSSHKNQDLRKKQLPKNQRIYILQVR